MSSSVDVQMSDGANIRTWTLGGEDKTKPLLITLHGAPGLATHVTEAAAFQSLADKYRVLTFDLRGSGASDNKGPFTDERWAADVEELRINAGAETFVLAGYSYGGFIAQTYALAYPGRLAGLILRDTWAWGYRGSLRVLKNILQSQRISPDPARQVRVWSGTMQDNADTEAALAEILPVYRPENAPPAPPLNVPFEGVSEEHGIRHEVHNAAWGYSVPRFDTRGRLREIKAPTLVVVGRHDPVCPVEDAQELAAGIPSSELVIFEESGHSPAADEPQKFSETVSKFLSTLSS